MLKSDVIEWLVKSFRPRVRRSHASAALADLLGVNPRTVHYWEPHVPEWAANRLHHMSGGVLKFDPQAAYAEHYPAFMIKQPESDLLGPEEC